MAVQFWAVDPQRVRRGALTPLSAKCVLRETGVGSWVITVDETAQWSPPVDRGWRVICVEDGQTVFSGPITKISTKEQGKIRDVELTGVTDMVALEDRIVLPTPTASPDAQSASAYWNRKGPAETLIVDLINGQAGPSAWQPWRTSGLVAARSQGRGARSSVNARFSVLLDEVSALATAGKLVVDIVQVGTDLVPTVRVPVDRSRQVRFTLQSGLDSYELSETAPTATAVLVGGQGEGTARTLKLGSQASTWGRTVVRFQDRRDTDDAEEITKAITETLTEGAESAAATVNVTETEDKKFGVHWRLGDVVTVNLPGGGEIVDGARAVDITWTPHGRDLEVTVGPPGTEPEKTPAQVKLIKQLQRRARGLETRR